MIIKPLITLPDPRLRLISKPVERIDDATRQFARDLFETMYDAPGIGLAAIQVGEPLRMLVIDIAKEGEEPMPMTVVNPEVVWRSDKRSVYEEGCLSIPDYYAEVERPEMVRVKYLDENVTEQEVEANGLLATCLQHEIDHLDGILFIDYISKLKRDMVIRKFKKLTKDHQPIYVPTHIVG